MSDIPEVKISLRMALPSDLAWLKHWDEQPHVIACDPDDDWQWARELQRTPPWREQLIAELNGRPLGFVQIIDPAQEETHYWGDVQPNLRAIDIWIGAAADLGKGYGTTMMQLALECCFADSLVTGILVDPLASNVRAHRFYRRLGFKFVEQGWLGDSDTYVFFLSRQDWQQTNSSD